MCEEFLSIIVNELKQYIDSHQTVTALLKHPLAHDEFILLFYIIYFFHLTLAFGTLAAAETSTAPWILNDDMGLHSPNTRYEFLLRVWSALWCSRHSMWCSSPDMDTFLNLISWQTCRRCSTICAENMLHLCIYIFMYLYMKKVNKWDRLQYINFISISVHTLCSTSPCRDATCAELLQSTAT